MNIRLILFFSAACVLAGCDSRPAPSPTPNPKSHAAVKLRITVEKSKVNRVEVFSTWVVGNLGCAPISYPAGNRNIKQVDTPEKVEKVGDVYVATIVADRFISDECRWIDGGVGINFFHDDYLLSVAGVSGGVLRGEKISEMTCLTRPFAKVGVCAQRSQEAYYKSEDKDAFNAAVGIIK